MEDAFSSGYDPSLELAIHSAKAQRHVGQDDQRPDLELEIGQPEPWTQFLRRKEQDVIDLIVKGEEAGHYYVLLGAKVAKIFLCDPSISTFRSGHGKNDDDPRCNGFDSSRGRRHVRCTSRPRSF